MRQPLLSIIMSVFNMERQIEKAINSIIGQSFDNFELIIVNDGSTDGTDAIIQKKTIREPRIYYSKIKNVGVSSARNHGLAIARGQFVLFIDADDEIEHGYLEHIMNMASTYTADIYIWGITKYCPDGTSISWNPCLRGTYDRKVFFANLPKEQYGKHKGIYGFVANKMVRTSVLRVNNIHFTPYLKLMEDYSFYLDCYAHCSTFCCFEETGYRYIVNDNTDKPRRCNPVSYPSLITIQEKCAKLLEINEAMTAENKEILDNAIAQLVIAMFLEMSDVSTKKVSNCLYFLQHSSYAIPALHNASTNWRLLKKIILWQQTHLIYIYVKCWRAYLKVRTRVW